MFSIWICLVLCPTSIICQYGYEDFFNKSRSLHMDFCGLSKETSATHDNKCCGYCDSYADCWNRETCCVSRFLGPGHNCIYPRFLSSEKETNYPTISDADSYWMVTNCPKETIGFYTIEGLQNLCENPNEYNFLEAHLPVSHFHTAVHYRNVFCAFCWNVSPMKLKAWQLESHCHKSLHASDSDILGETRLSKCNLFYRPPYRYDKNKCTIPQYSIHQCNQSGLWKEKDQMIEWGCTKYFDPFNATFKNVFCYLCNVDGISKPDELICPDISQGITTKKAPHIARFDVVAWRETLYKELQYDQMTEFRDYKMGMCRLIHCDPDKVLSVNRHYSPEYFCRQPEGEDLQQQYCVSLYIRLTDISRQRRTYASLLKTHFFITAIQHTIRHNIYESIRIVKVELFAKYELLNTDLPVEYFVVKALLGQNFASYKYVSLGIENLHRKVITLYLNDDQLFFSEVEWYEEIGNGKGKAIVSYTNKAHLPDILTVFGFDEYWEIRSCLPNLVKKLHKTNICQYLKIKIDEFPMTLINGTLILNGEYLTMSLSRFEQKVTNDTVHICLEDFMLFYNALADKTTQNNIHTQYNIAVICNGRVFFILMTGVLFVCSFLL